MKRIIVTLVVVIAALLFTNQARAGTLERGVHISPIFAGLSNGNPTISQLKYQMAVDVHVGITTRYKTITNTYYDYTDSTINTFNVDVANSDSSTSNVTITNTYQP